MYKTKLKEHSWGLLYMSFDLCKKRLIINGAKITHIKT